MSQTIEAIYENGVFRPLQPVELPEGTMVSVEATPAPEEFEEQLRQKLLAEGLTSEEIEKIFENFRLLWDSYRTLTPEQKQALEEARFNHSNLFRSGDVNDANSP